MLHLQTNIVRMQPGDVALTVHVRLQATTEHRRHFQRIEWEQLPAAI